MKRHVYPRTIRDKKFLVLTILTTIIVPVLFLDGVTAQAVDSEEILLNPINITAVLHTNGSTTVHVKARVHNQGFIPLFDVSIRMDSLNLVVVSAKSDGVSTMASTTQMERHTMITVNLQREVGMNESVWIELVLQANDLQSSTEVGTSGEFLQGGLVFYMRPRTPISNFTFITILPSHASLSHDSAVPLFPEADTNFTDGESIVFTWYISSLQPGQESVFIVRFQEPITTVESEESIFILALVGIVGIFVGIGITIVGPNLVSRLKRTEVVRYHGITSEEEMIIQRIIAKGGSSSQKELYQQLDIGESKLSLILRGLEERGLVKRFREGRENIVHIVET